VIKNTLTTFPKWGTLEKLLPLKSTKRNIMLFLKKLIKLFSIVIVTILLLIAITIGLAAIFQDEITDYTIKQIESTIDAPIAVGKVSVVPFYSFPRLSAKIHNLYVGDPESQNNDTLLYINSLKVGMDSWDLMSGKITIEQMQLSGLAFDYLVDSSGQSNIDFILNAFSDSLQNSNTETTSTIDIDAKKVELENILVRYSDNKSNIDAHIYIPALQAKGKSSNNELKGTAEGKLILSNCNIENTNINLMESCVVGFKLNYENNIAVVEELRLNGDGFDINVEGNLELSDTLSVEGLVVAKNVDLSIIDSYFTFKVPDEFKFDSLPVIDFLSVDIDANYHVDNLNINKLIVSSQPLEIGLNGSFLIKDTIAVDAKVSNLDLNISALSKFIPENYFKDFDIEELGGQASITADLKGYIADSTLLPDVSANITLTEVKVMSKEYPKIDNLGLKAVIEPFSLNNYNDVIINLNSFNASSDSSTFQLEGYFMGLKNTRYNLHSKINLDLRDFQDFIPDSLAANAYGRINAEITTSGIMPENFSDEFIDNLLSNSNISFQISELSGIFTDTIQVENFSSIINYESKLSGMKSLNISDLQLFASTFNLNLSNTSFVTTFKGDITKPETIDANISSFKAQAGNSKIIASGSLRDLTAPSFSISSNINLDLSDIKHYVPDSMVTNLSGNMAAHIRSQGVIHIDSIESQLLPIVFDKSTFEVALNDINIVSADTNMNIQDLNTRFGLRNDLLTIDNFSARYRSSTVTIDSAFVRNFYKTFILNQKEELFVEANLNVDQILFDEFNELIFVNMLDKEDQIIEDADVGKVKTEHAKKITNWNYKLHGSVKIGSIVIDSTEIYDYKINRLNVSNLNSLFLFTDSAFVIDQFKFNVFEGQMTNSFKYKLRNDGTQSLSSHNILKDVDIRMMLKDIDNFGLDSLITYHNLSGILTTDLHTFVPIEDTIVLDRMLVSGDITLEKGGVYDYEPATEISRFTNVKELDNIQFKTLNSSIFMFKNKLYVPRTNIVSNAIDIAAFGMQDLDGDCEYHLELHLSNILFGKSKRRNRKQDSTGDDIDPETLKKRSQKIKYVIKDDKSRVSPDTKESREDMMNKIRVQKKMLDFIFFPKNIHYNTDPDQQ
jgi:hypothetical protein